MNIATLDKYWKELEYYKNGGSLQARVWISDPNDGDTSYTLWYKVGEEGWDINKVFSYTLDYDNLQIIMDDSYSIYRKALAEGKIIQFHYTNSTIGLDEWQDINNLAFLHSTDLYRIKPEEPKFKIGDWVRNNSSNVTFKYTTGMLKPDPFCCEHWQPQPDDYAWFYDYEKYTPTFGKFIQVENDKYLAEIADGKGSLRLVAFTYCEPFLGTLPTFLKPE